MPPQDEELAIMRTICLQPADDTPPLVFADFLAEHDESHPCGECESGRLKLHNGPACPSCKDVGFVSNGFAARAEFIRVQCELAKHAPRYKGIEPWALSPAGPNYYVASSGARTDRGMLIVCAKPGDRFDVIPHAIHGGGKVMHGLRFTKFVGDDDGEAVLVRDELSVPDTTEPLRRRERELLTRHVEEWVRVFPGLPDWADRLGWQPPKTPDAMNGGYIGYEIVGGTVRSKENSMTFFRGFPSTLTCSWADWLRVADKIAWGPVPCKVCKGKGKVPKGPFGPHREPLRKKPCPSCAGHGWTPPTMVCAECEGDGRKFALVSDRHCPRCSGTGRVPRPMPKDAQPVSRVRLTTMPEVEHIGYSGGWTDHPDTPIFRLVGYQPLSGNQMRLGIADDGTQYDDMRYPQWMSHVTSRLLAAEWPWITFSLPAAETADWDGNDMGSGM